MEQFYIYFHQNLPQALSWYQALKSCWNLLKMHKDFPLHRKSVSVQGILIQLHFLFKKKKNLTNYILYVFLFNLKYTIIFNNYTYLPL